MEYKTMLAILFVLIGITGILYWATYAPGFLTEKFHMNCDTSARSMGCTALLSLGYVILIGLIIGGVVGLFAGVQL
jgi:hypothetical protein